MISGSCHCGAVTFEVDDAPQWLVACNCSVCRRLAALWFHTTTDKVRLTGGSASYAWGDKMLSFQRCENCGCVTHYLPLDGSTRMALNMRMADPGIFQESAVHPVALRRNHVCFINYYQIATV